MTPITYKPNPSCQGGMEVHRYGRYVSVKEYNAIKGENKRLRKARDDAKEKVERMTHLANQSEFYRSQLQKDTFRLENIQMQDFFKHYEAENASLKAEVEFLRKQYSEAVGQFRPMRIENENLKADVERLRKAGDAMAEEIIGCYKGEGYDPKNSETLPKWNAAKEDSFR